MPDTYRSSAKVFADTDSILKPLLKGVAVENDPAKQVAVMVKNLLSRANVEKIARESDLDVYANSTIEYEGLISSLQSNIQINAVSTSSNRRAAPNIFNISYSHRDPKTAKNVVQATLNTFVESTLGEKREDRDVANRFLDNQINEYEQRLLTDERKLSDFKRKYRDLVSGEVGGYYRELSAQEELLEQARLELEEAQTQYNALKQQSAKQAEALNDGIETKEFSTVYDNRIDALQQRLDDLLVRYTERHPDVVKTSELIENLENKRRLALEELKQSFNQGQSMTLATPIMQDMQIKLNEYVSVTQSLQVRVARYESKVDELAQKIELIPQVEAELTALNRNYDITKSKYEDLLNRRENAAISQNASQSTDDIKFRIIEPPRVPLKPTGPPRTIYLIATTIASFGIGIALSFLMSQLTPVISSPRQIHTQLNLPVFGVVSATESSGIFIWEKKKAIIFWLSNIAITLLLMAAIYINHSPKLIESVMTRVGNL